MSNHYHMMVTTPKMNLSAGMQYLQTQTSKAIRDSALRINHVYGGRYKPSIIRTADYFAHCLKYVLRNPIRAGITSRVEDYPWSTISSGDLEMKRLIVVGPETLRLLVPKNQSELIDWLYTPTPKEVELAVKRGLKKATFEFTPDRASQKAIDSKRDLGPLHPQK